MADSSSAVGRHAVAADTSESAAIVDADEAADEAAAADAAERDTTWLSVASIIHR